MTRRQRAWNWIRRSPRHYASRGLRVSRRVQLGGGRRGFEAGGRARAGLFHRTSLVCAVPRRARAGSTRRCRRSKSRSRWTRCRLASMAQLRRASGPDAPLRRRASLRGGSSCIGDRPHDHLQPRMQRILALKGDYDEALARSWRRRPRPAANGSQLLAEKRIRDGAAGRQREWHAPSSSELTSRCSASGRMERRGRSATAYAALGDRDRAFALAGSGQRDRLTR